MNRFVPKLHWEKVDSVKPLLDHWKDNESLASNSRPSNVFNGMISPLKNFPLAGVIWYQGESNIGRGAQYKTLLRVLIDDWREQFKDFWFEGNIKCLLRVGGPVDGHFRISLENHVVRKNLRQSNIRSNKLKRATQNNDKTSCQQEKLSAFKFHLV